MEYETVLFLISAGAGAALLLAYELLLALRKTVPHHPLASAAEDVLYWSLTGFFLFYMIYRFNSGALRFFFFLGCFTGSALCRLTVSGLFRRVMETVFGIPMFFVKFSTKRLLFLVKRGNIFVGKCQNPPREAENRSFCKTKRSSRVEKSKKTEKQKENSE